MAETRKNACPDCGGALDHWRGSVACEEYKVRTDQTAQLKHPEEDRYAIDTPETAQGEAGGEWECWTCGHCPTGEHGSNGRCRAVGHLVPYRSWHTSKERHTIAGHDVRRVEGKA